MNSMQQHHTLLTTLHYGGNFYRELAKAAIVADPDNKARIFAAFPDLEILYGPNGGLYSENH